MDGRELRAAIFREQSGVELPMKWKCIMMGMTRCTSGAASPSLRRTMTSIKGSLCFLTTTVVRRSLM
jgi:hypothetical protein